MNISQDEVPTIVRTILKVGGGEIIEQGSVSSAGWETISLGVASVVTLFIWGLLLAKADAKIKAA